jgi:hypothetical protein
MPKSLYEGTFCETEDDFLGYCAEQVAAGECDLSAGELGVLLKIIARYRTVPQPEQIDE